MNEELQSKIAIALDKMINGAPEMWLALANELQTKNLIQAVFAGILFIIGLIVFRYAWPKADWDQGNKYCVVTVVSGVITFTSMFVGMVEVTNSLAPSIELIRMLR